MNCTSSARLRYCARLLAVGVSLSLLPAINSATARELRKQPAPVAKSRPEPGSAIAPVSKQVYRLLVKSETAIKGGTGFLVSGKRVIATNHHVVENGKAYILGYVGANGLVRRVGLRLLAIYPQKDLALLEAFQDLPGEALPLAADYPELASDLFAIGFPAAADLRLRDDTMQTEEPDFFLPSVVKGTVSRIMTDPSLTSQLQHQAPISHGYSGGPLVEKGGIVVGVSSAISKETTGISYGVTTPDLARLLAACSLPIRDVYLARVATNAPPIYRTSLDGPNMPPDEPHKLLPTGDQGLLDRAHTMLRQGDVGRARLIFEFLVREKQLPAAYLGLARTYDPHVLKELAVVGIQADAGKAGELYKLAGVQDYQEAEASAVSPSACNKSLCSMFKQRGSVQIVRCQSPLQSLSIPAETERRP